MRRSILKGDVARFTIVWLLLVGMTLLAWRLVHVLPSSDGRLSTSVVALMLIMAFAKAGLVVSYFMEVRLAPRLFGAAFTLCGVALCIALILLVT